MDSINLLNWNGVYLFLGLLAFAIATHSTWLSWAAWWLIRLALLCGASLIGSTLAESKFGFSPIVQTCVGVTIFVTGFGVMF